MIRGGNPGIPGLVGGLAVCMEASRIQRHGKEENRKLRSRAGAFAPARLLFAGQEVVWSVLEQLPVAREWRIWYTEGKVGEKMKKITVIQPKYYAGQAPDKAIAEFLLREAEQAEAGSLVVLPEYANAGGLSDSEQLLAAAQSAPEMLQRAACIAKRRGIYLSVNVLERREGKLRNSTYLYDKTGATAFIYDKVHLPPAEVRLGIVPGDGSCVCDLDGIRFAFMTCYDVYFYEQTEWLARWKPDVTIVPGYQRAERWDIIQAQTKMLAFRCNAYVARASYSMDSTERGGNTMIVAPDGRILTNLGADVGSATAQVDPKWKYMRTAGFGGGLVRNDDFINQGLCHGIFED